LPRDRDGQLARADSELPAAAAHRIGRDAVHANQGTRRRRSRRTRPERWRAASPVDRRAAVRSGRRAPQRRPMRSLRLRGRQSAWRARQIQAAA
jgi:hypothetical protein